MRAHHCYTHHPHASYQSTVSQLQIHPSLPALHYWSWTLNIFQAGTKLNFVSKGHWRDTGGERGLPSWFQCVFLVRLLQCVVYLQCPVARSMQHLSMSRYFWSRASSSTPSVSLLKVQRWGMSSTKDGFPWTSESRFRSPTTMVSQWTSLYQLSHAHALSYKVWISAIPGGRPAILECSISALGFVAVPCLLFLYFSEFSNSD